MTIAEAKDTIALATIACSNCPHHDSNDCRIVCSLAMRVDEAYDTLDAADGHGFDALRAG